MRPDTVLSPELEVLLESPDDLSGFELELRFRIWKCGLDSGDKVDTVETLMQIAIGPERLN